MHDTTSYKTTLAELKDVFAQLDDAITRSPDWRVLSPDDRAGAVATYLECALLSDKLLSEVYALYFSEMEAPEEDEVMTVLHELGLNELISPVQAEEFVDAQVAALIFLGKGEIGGDALYQEYLGKVPHLYGTLKAIAWVTESLPKGLERTFVKEMADEEETR